MSEDGLFPITVPILPFEKKKVPITFKTVFNNSSHTQLFCPKFYYE